MAELQSRLSVGARIIRYKTKLAKKNHELHEYFVQSKELASNVSSIAYKLEEVINECVSQGVGNSNGEQLEKLRKLQADMKHITENVEMLNNGHEEEGDDA